ncbi:YggS family pyridoxal phosphate-dependent enzyme [Ornithinibacillus contaminans]|uniref:YggS family pyridoxal phosphate-dependent enzyme n=1 Tax=Ornithinibacillus contaminans TaxID=694055 RepID=UPI00064D85B1|nr:YggS family pyridoxal phosphate-dependent enzyme [Ornithinibacillus contaminans]
MDVASNLATIQKTIQAAASKSNRSPDEITIIGVTKYVTIERTAEAIEAGITHLGENRQEGLLHKYEHFKKQATWHFIGSLQTRKVKDIIDKVDYIHSLDRLSLAKEINNRATSVIKCFVQVNVSGEASKHGMTPEEIIPFLEKISEYSNIHVVGLMTMAPHTDDETVIRKVFRDLNALRETVRNKQYQHASCPYLSMGMSNDYHIAIEEGATHIRIGSKLVGTE